MGDKKVHDPPYHEKKRVAIWRGSSTGLGSRFTLVEKFESTVHAKAFSIYNFGKLGTAIGRYFSRRSNLDQKIDVCFTNLCQEATETPEKEKYYSTFLCDQLKLQQILDYRYLIAVEGNDV